ncbi:unnamed protein product [Hyaloperonospora brassicae]|uniref:PX domain-containing protein n=1 Tax=Hyaloperonospora brassicae TaxID=162125 RepID=A0AAV0U5I7_HYABA|nr:unnamed protein product [Hyaloperonospora brassicae]
MEAAASEHISVALGLTRPFLSESNRAFTPFETWDHLSALLVTQPLQVQPLGYYRTPQSIDIYVFECVLRDTSGSQRYRWKIYRRYRQFHKYVLHSANFSASHAVDIPHLPQGPVQLFHARHCKDRLVELSKWLAAVVETTRTYYMQLHRRQEAQGRDKRCALQPQRLAQEAKKKTTNKQVQSHLTSAKSLAGPRSSSRAPRQQQKRSVSLKAIEQLGDPVLCVLRADETEAFPVMMLSSFLFAGANCPFPRVFQGLPTFALALEEQNVQLLRRALPAYPSRLKNAIVTRAGLGLRLTPNHEQDGLYLGATVADFLRNRNELDPALVDVPVGARLVRVNGIDVNDWPFDQLLIQLRSLAVPLRLTFRYDPHLKCHKSNTVTSHSHVDATSAAEPISGEQSGEHCTRKGSCAECSVLDHTDMRNESMNSGRRTSSADSSQSKFGWLALVFGNLFGCGNAVSTTSKLRWTMDADFISLSSKRQDKPADVVSGPGCLSLLDGGKPVLCSWDEVGGESQNIVLRGFYSHLPHSLLRELRLTDRNEVKANDCNRKRNQNESCAGEINMEVINASASPNCEALGVWSTAYGCLGSLFGACTIQNVEAARLMQPPVFFSTSAEHCASEKDLRTGLILVAINNESTFGHSFATVMERLRLAARPTSICFRWYEDFSPFLDTNVAEKHESCRYLPSRSSNLHATAAEAFASYLDCVAVAQTDLSFSLQLALTENASIRDELSVLRDVHCKLGLAQERAAQREHVLQATIEQRNGVIAKLNEKLDVQRHELENVYRRACEAETKLALHHREYKARLDKATKSVKVRLAEREEQLIKESNRSIVNANYLAERRALKMLETAANELRYKHEEYLQQLAEEHAEEVESLVQQVAVWRHQVEVLTEAERRNYVALMSKGVHPYGEDQRARVGYVSTDPLIGHRMKGHHDDNDAYISRPETTLVSRANTNVGRGCSPEDDSGKDVPEAAFRTPNMALQVRHGTFWDRMVSLLATE